MQALLITAAVLLLASPTHARYVMLEYDNSQCSGAPGAFIFHADTTCAAVAGSSNSIGCTADGSAVQINTYDSSTDCNGIPSQAATVPSPTPCNEGNAFACPAAPSGPTASATFDVVLISYSGADCSGGAMSMVGRHVGVCIEDADDSTSSMLVIELNGDYLLEEFNGSGCSGDVAESTNYGSGLPCRNDDAGQFGSGKAIVLSSPMSIEAIVATYVDNSSVMHQVNLMGVIALVLIAKLMN
eukprot:TRINITY_DN12306_c0_g2_i1.p2 TRINITY_DN12306_c0_g2~~TRINITY_DN12306_c0_g2_i1.p2  ORF type:complete len:242 (+),score=43.18 TRINITY_DN12306_c0_g2_i1:172-897(+)